MFQMITIIIAVAAIILSFVMNPAWAWLLIAGVDIFICIQLWAVKQKYRFNSISDLSTTANDLLQRYGYYFAMPFASKDFSASAATCQFAGIILAIIGVFKSFWWAIALGVANWFIMGYISVSLSPVSLLVNTPFLRVAHDEIVEYMNNAGSNQEQNTD